MSGRDLLYSDNVRLLEQGIALLEGLEDDLYAKPEPLVSLSGIGSHVRHCVDYYACFLAGLDERRVDFDRRQRDPRIETDRTHALERLRALTTDLARARTSDATELRIKMDSGLDDEANAPWSVSSIERELHFLMSHTVHHYALIAVILRANGLEPPDDFGVAPSTLRHWEEKKACAR